MNTNYQTEQDRRQRTSLTLLFSVIVFAILIAALGIVAAIIMILTHNGVIRIDQSLPVIDHLILAMAFSTALICLVVTFFASRIPLRPVNKLINALNRLASGDYRTRLSFGGPIGGNATANELCQSFNRMASELENTEMLRSDFVNNFSHEFKTPIVSIAGFAGLLKHGNLTEEQRAEYVDIIEKESKRLVSLATNILNLTKIENQTILTDVTSFNLSEQIRNSVLLLESKWAPKNLDLCVDLEEYTVTGNEELLAQVWINLVDNAVKFSPEGGVVEIRVEETDEKINVSVSNNGSEIPPETTERIFRKFYQADESHAAEGNGIGLAIVKKITELHNGTVRVASEDGKTTFTVTLPRRISNE